MRKLIIFFSIVFISISLGCYAENNEQSLKNKAVVYLIYTEITTTTPIFINGILATALKRNTYYTAEIEPGVLKIATIGAVSYYGEKTFESKANEPIYIKIYKRLKINMVYDFKQLPMEEGTKIIQDCRNINLSE